jgi:hypothetical protein
MLKLNKELFKIKYYIYKFTIYIIYTVEFDL